jgi:hypothetical protein
MQISPADLEINVVPTRFCISTYDQSLCVYMNMKLKISLTECGLFRIS